MELIDLYIKEVGKHLPNKTHEDIENEIRSMIMDALEDQSKAEGRPVDDVMVEKVLKRLGPPGEMAASYLPPRYLIGPELYPHFLTTIKIVLAVVLILSAVGLGISFCWKAQLPVGVTEELRDAAVGLLGSIWTVIGIVVFIFAILQHFALDFKGGEKDAWQPGDLYALQDDESVKVGELVAEAIMCLLMILILNTYPGVLSVFDGANGIVILPEMTAAFQKFLPWISVLWSLQAGFNFWLIARNRWEVSTRLMTIGLSAGSVVLAVLMLLGPALIQIGAEELAKLQAMGVTFGELGTLADVINLSIRIALLVVVIIELVEIGKQVYRLFRVRIPALA
jgi:hypothetical protein